MWQGLRNDPKSLPLAPLRGALGYCALEDRVAVHRNAYIRRYYWRGDLAISSPRATGSLTGASYAPGSYG